MPAPYRDKNILEMSDREREARRIEALMQPGRDAVEGVYPEEFLVPAARAASKAAQIALQRTPKVAPKVEMPGEVKPNVPARPYYMRGNLTNENYNPKDFTPAKMEQIKKDLAQEAKLSPQELRLKRMREYDQKMDVRDAKKALLDRSMLSAGVNVSQDEQAYKRGGAVKAKSRRGDGIAQRGKTKGRFV
jgi:hypothetical protein